MGLGYLSGGWGGGGVEIFGGGVVQKRESPDFRSPEVGISVIMSKSRGVLPYKSDGGARRTF